MKISILGSYGEYNLGDEAILEGLLSFFNEEYNVAIAVFSHKPVRSAKIHSFKNVYCLPMMPSGVRSFARQLKSKAWKKSKKFLKESDVIIVGGGGIFYEKEIDHKGFSPLFIWYIRCFIFKYIIRKPFILLGVGVSQLNNKQSQRYFKSIMKWSKYAIFRDEDSYDKSLAIYNNQDIGVIDKKHLDGLKKLLADPRKFDVEDVLPKKLDKRIPGLIRWAYKLFFLKYIVRWLKLMLFPVTKIIFLFKIDVIIQKLLPFLKDKDLLSSLPEDVNKLKISQDLAWITQFNASKENKAQSIAIQLRDVVDLDKKKCIRKIISIVENVIENLDMNIRYFPMSYEGPDDRELMRTIIKNSNYQKKQEIVECSSPKRVREEMQQSKIMIATRFHGIILSIQAGSIPIALSYTDKTDNLIKDINEYSEEQGLEIKIPALSIHNFSVKDVIYAIKYILENEEELLKMLTGYTKSNRGVLVAELRKVFSVYSSENTD